MSHLRAISFISLTSLLDSTPAAAQQPPPDPPAWRLPWKLQTPYTFDWFEKKQKIGEIRFHFTEVREAGAIYTKLSSRRKLQKLKQGETASGELVFRGRGEPLRYDEEVRITQLGREAGQQVRIRFSGKRVESTHINNGREDRAVRHRVDVPAKTFLFATYALEHWTLLALQLKEKKIHRLHLFYPQIARVGTMTFTPAREDDLLEPGERKTSLLRYRFEDKANNYRGTVWVDDAGRMVRYEAGVVRLVLRKK